jgi:hypothetical protein
MPHSSDRLLNAALETVLATLKTPPPDRQIVDALVSMLLTHLSSAATAAPNQVAVPAVSTRSENPNLTVIGRRGIVPK